jgi:beta-lactamase regulating signal transducer with metallopeptidase domain
MSDCFQVLRPDSIRLGWALIHFFWQGLVIAVLLEISLGMVGRTNASLRYVLCGLALVAMPVCLIDTYLASGRDACTVTVLPVSSGQSISDGTFPKGIVFLPVVHTITDLTSREISSIDLNRCMSGIVAGWLIGVILLTGRKAGGFVVLWRLRRRGVSVPSDAMAELFRQACHKIGVDSRRVCLKISALVQVPMTMGWVRPVVLFPAALLSGLSTGEIELLLAHELAHIRRCDYLVNLLQTVVETLFFYHPVTWWISRRMRQERENSCDDLVASRSTEALAYAKVLLHLETIRLPGASLATAANGGNLLQRVERLIGEPAPTSGMGLPMLLVLLSILGVIAAASVVEAQTPPVSKSIVPMTAEELKRGGIAAMVNQHPIYEISVEQQTAATEKTLKEHLSGNELNQKIAEARQEALQTLIDRELIIESFKSAGGFIPQEYTNERIDDIVKDQYGGDRNAFLKTLAERRVTLEMYKGEIEDNAIVGYLRNKNVAEKVWQYYQDHLDLFPQDEQINITLIAIPCDENKPPGDHDQNPKYLAAQQALDQVVKGADFAVLAKTLANRYHYHRFFGSEPNQWNTTQWLTKDGAGSVHIPALWQAIEKLQSGQTSGIIEGDWFYGIARVNDRRPARIAATEETTKQKQALIDAEAKKLSETWLGDLRAKARIQTFAQP